MTAYPLTSIEVATSVAIGFDDTVPAVRESPDESTAHEVLRDILRGALSHPPCIVSFSGGRDSSLLLAIAAAVAREDGLGAPIPATLVFPDDADSDEAQWQRSVLDHIGVDERVELAFRGSEFDAIGPVASEVLQQHGALYPANTYCHRPIVALAAGGTVVTGMGGDELALSSVNLWAERVIGRRRIEHPKELLTVGASIAPRPVRYLTSLVEPSPIIRYNPWLRRRARWQVRRESARADARRRLGWAHELRTGFLQRRALQATVHDTALMAAPFGTTVVHPLVDARLLDALAREAPFVGVGGRDQLVRLLAHGLLPEPVVRRASKAHFSASIRNEPTRDFARTWDGTGVDHALVDWRVLRREWLSPRVGAPGLLPLQTAWLASHPDGPS